MKRTFDDLLALLPAALCVLVACTGSAPDEEDDEKARAEQPGANGGAGAVGGGSAAGGVGGTSSSGGSGGSSGCTYESLMGEPCRTDCDCATRHPFQVNGNWYSKEIEQICLTEEETGLPGGWCTLADCYYDVVTDPCNEFGYECVAFGKWSSGKIASLCAERCEDHDKCREDTVCQPFGTNLPSLCWPSCPGYTDCGDEWTCNAEGVCVENDPCQPVTCAQLGLTCGVADDGCGHTLQCGPPCPPGPLDGCTDWSTDWSCTDLSPTLCSCSCYAWPHSGTAPRVECELTGPNEVWCTCTTGGEPGQKQTESIQLSAGGASCGQSEAVFNQSFCGLVP